MKKLFTLFSMLLLSVCLFAQVPQKMNYQAVVRNASNSLVANQNVSARISILQGSATGAAVYSETHNVQTNANGLMTLEIGGGSATNGSFAAIDWANGPYFIKSEIDPEGGINYSVTTTQQLMSVPYALYAGSAANGFSGDYNDLTNKPTIPEVPENVSAFTNDAGYITDAQATTVVENYTQNAGYVTQSDLVTNNYVTAADIPTNVSAFANDAGYITAADVPAQVNADWNATEGAAQILNKPELFSGDYNDLQNKPALFDGDYNSLTNTPAIPTVPTNVSAFTNDAGYITNAAVPTNVSELTNDANYITAADVPAQVNADWNATQGAAEILNKPELFSGDYNDLQNKPALFDGDYNSLTNTPAIPTVPTNVSAFTNDAGYITNAAVPTNVSELTNDANYITAADVPAQVNADWNATEGAAEILNKPELFSGDYNDLQNKPALFDGDYNSLTNTPAIPTVPTNVSAFTNDAGYLTQATVQEAANIPTNVSAFTNDAGYITNAAVPTNVSELTNDANYITAADVPAQVNADWNATEGAAQILNKPELFSGDYNDLQNKPALFDGDYNSLTNTPAIPTVPTNVSAFTNDAGYITNAAVPTNVSELTNDANYITAADVPAQVNADWNATEGAAEILNKPELFSGDYNDLQNKPTIPTTTGELTNNSGFITASAVPTNVSQLNNDAGYVSNNNCPTVNLCDLYSTLTTLQNTVTSMQNTLEDQQNTISDLQNTVDAQQNTISSQDSVINALNNELHPQAFACGTSTVTDHEGNVYNTVQIGDQCWTRENMRCTTSPSTGTTILEASPSSYSYTGKKAYYVNGSSSNTSTYGLLYNWCAAVDTFNTAYGETSTNTEYSNAPSVTFGGNRRGICPVGWHVPSDAEWTQLTTYVSSQSEYVCGSDNTNIGKALASTTGWNSYTGTSSNMDCYLGYVPANNNATGFSAVPAGYYGGSYGDFGNIAYFWSATQNNSNYAYLRNLYYYYADVYRNYSSKYYGYSVRCLRDGGVGGAPATNESVYNATDARIDSLENVINAQNEQMGPQFECGHSTVKDYDGNVYTTAKIGDQCWMKQNLKTTHYSDGTAIALGVDESTTTPYRYYPDGNSSNVDSYGYLYNWTAAMHGAASSSSNPSGVQGVCPMGWHVPSAGEYQQLNDFNTNNPAAHAVSEFDPILAGVFSGDYREFNSFNNIWTSTETGDYSSYYFYSSGSYLQRDDYVSAYAISVRCLRDIVDGGVAAANETGRTAMEARIDSLENVIDALMDQLCGAYTVADHEGNIYHTVKVGSQCWLKENMRCTTSPSTGTTILEASPSSYSYTGKKAYYVNGSSSNTSTYGLLYNWNAAVDTFNTAYGETSTNTSSSNAVIATFSGNRRGICPQGWHIPSDAEWTQLTTYVGSQSEYVCGSDNTYIAKALASTTGWSSSTTTCAVGNTPANNNATGFSAVPAGNYYGSYTNFGNNAYFWSATQYDSNFAYSRNLNYNNASVNRYNSNKNTGYSVRCIRD